MCFRFGRRFTTLLLFSFPGFISASCLDHFFGPDGTPVEIASFFAGSARLEATLAKRLGLPIEAVDVKPIRTDCPWVRPRTCNLTEGKLGSTYDRILLVSPWFKPRTRFLMNADPIEIPFVPRSNTVVEKTARNLRSLFEDPARGLHLATVISGPALQIADRTKQVGPLFEERLGQLYEAVAIARDHLRPEGKIVLISELLHTVLAWDEPTPGHKTNHLLAWPAYREATQAMLEAGFEGMRVRALPQAQLDDMLGDFRTDNSWGQAALEGWVLDIANIAVPAP